MLPLRHILFPYDFSAQGQQVARFVRALAWRAGARVTLFSVVPPSFEPVAAGMDMLPGLAEDPAAARRALQKLLEDALVPELAGVPVDRVADAGDPAFRAADFARTHAVDLIMLPTHGVGIYRRMLLGSTTAKILHDAECPVWTAAHVETQTAPELPQSILCAVDGSPATPALVRWAAGFASGIGAALSVFHVVEPVTDWPSLERERRLQEQVRKESVETLAGMLTSAGVEAPLRVAVGRITEAVTEEIQRSGAGLVVLGRGGVAEPFGRLRTHAFGIIQRSSCPVISV